MKKLRYTLLALAGLAVLSFEACKPTEAPLANFGATSQTIFEGETVDFNDLSTNEPTEWSWTFEGGTPSTSSLQNPSGILYSIPGTYSVTLTATNDGGSNTKTSSLYLLVRKDPALPTVEFSASRSTVALGVPINFTDLSTNDPISWEWTFEGGTPSTSTDRNPTGIEYNANGTYDVTLKATNAKGASFLTKSEFITVDESAINNLKVVSNALAIKSSGTRCPPCGGWGWNIWSDVISTKNNIVPFTIHSANFVSENYINDESNDLDTYLGINSWPSFLTAGNDSRLTKINIAGGTEASIAQELKGNIDDATTNDPIATAALNWEVSNGTISVTSYVEFLKPTVGDYYVSVWVSEDEIYGPQSGHPDANAYHKKVLRIATDNHAVFGVPVASGDTDINTILVTEHSARFDNSWNESNINVAVIIWKKVGTSYYVINASEEIYQP